MAEEPVKRGKKQEVSREQVYSALRRAGFNKSEAIKMTAIAGPESNYDLGNVRSSNESGTGGHNMLGLFQISDIHQDTSWFKKYGKNWQDIDNQAELAKAVYDSQGLTRYSWASYGNPRYLKELPKASAAAQRVGDDYKDDPGKPSHPSKPSHKPGSKPPKKSGSPKPGSKPPKGGTGAPAKGSGKKKPKKEKTFDLFSNPWAIIAIALVLIGLVMK